jgi:AcrR family transcriptional regulator
MIELTAEHSYEGVSMRDLTAAAKVSSRTFYKQFSGKQACFESTHGMLARRLTERMLAAQAAEPDPAQVLRRAIGVFLSELDRDPRAARLLLVEPQLVGDAARAQTRRVVRPLVGAITRCLVSGSSKPAPPPFVAEGLALGVERMARSRLIAGRESELPQLAEPLASWVLRQCNAVTVALVDPAPLGLQESALAGVHLLPSSDKWREEGGDLALVPTGDRALLLSAAVKLAAGQDCRNLTVSEICTAAGVSRPRFHARFEGVEDCLLSALEVRVSEMLARAERAVALGQGWAGGVYRAVVRICSEAFADSSLAGLVAGWAGAAVDWGALGAERRERLLTSVTDYICRKVSAASDQRLEVEASIEAAWGLLRDRVAGRDVGEVPRLAATMATFVLTSAIGPEATRTAIEAETELLGADAGRRPALASVA